MKVFAKYFVYLKKKTDLNYISENFIYKNLLHEEL